MRLDISMWIGCYVNNFVQGYGYMPYGTPTTDTLGHGFGLEVQNFVETSVV
jgi:hypothetical protein